jgi:hypothetical protein
VNACSRLSEWKSPRVRSLALRLLRDDPRRALDDGVLGLLERNAQERDAATVAAALPPRASAETRDHWVRGVKGIVNPLARGSSKPRSSAVWTPLLVRALDVTPCRECREYVLDLLVERGAATEAILREALFDANDETRATARKALRRS